MKVWFIIVALNCLRSYFL